MGHVTDQWMRKVKDGKKVRSARWGRGKRWLARWVEPGGREASKAFASKDAALAHLTEVDGALRGGTYVRPTNQTFREYATTWLEQQVHQRDGTAQQAEGKLRLHAFPVIGDRALRSLTRADIQNVIVQATSLGPDATRVLFVYVKAVLDSAVEDRLIQSSPCTKINLPEITKKLVIPLRVDQVLRLHGHAPAHLARAVLFAAGTGMRPGEWRSITEDRYSPGRVRLDRQLAEGTSSRRVVWGPLKTDASYRTVRLAPATEKVLLEQLEQASRGPEGLVFTSFRGGPLRRSQLSYAWDVASAGMALPGRSGWHDLRHHHASLLIARGLSPRAVADRLGHGDPSETMRTYAHLWGSDEERMLEAIEDAYGGLDAGPDGAGT